MKMLRAAESIEYRSSYSLPTFIDESILSTHILPCIYCLLGLYKVMYQLAVLEALANAHLSLLHKYLSDVITSEYFRFEYSDCIVLSSRFSTHLAIVKSTYEPRILLQWHRSLCLDFLRSGIYLFVRIYSARKMANKVSLMQTVIYIQTVIYMSQLSFPNTVKVHLDILQTLWLLIYYILRSLLYVCIDDVGLS